MFIPLIERKGRDFTQKLPFQFQPVVPTLPPFKQIVRFVFQQLLVGFSIPSFQKLVYFHITLFYLTHGWLTFLYDFQNQLINISFKFLFLVCKGTK